MARTITAGVTLAVRDSEVSGLSDADQDRLISEVAQHLQRELREHVKDSRPVGDFKFWVTGPHDDPILGHIHVHHLAAPFDMDRLPTDSPAYLAEMRGVAPDPKTVLPGPVRVD